MTQPLSTLDTQFEELKSENYQLELAEQAQEVIFANQEAQQKTAQTINEFIDDYLVNGRNQPIKQWLVGRFSLYPELWENEQEKIETAQTIIEMIDCVVSNQVEIEQHIQKGKSLPNFIHKKIEKIAQENDVPSELIQQGIDIALNQGNLAHTELYLQQPIDLLPVAEQSQGLDGARQITEKLKLNANLNLAWYGAKAIGSRLFNSLTGQENRSRGEELLHIIRSAVDSAENKGVQVAVSGGMVVSAKKGWVRGVFDTVEKIENTIERAREKVSRIQNLVLNVADGWNDLRLLDQVERGVLQEVDVTAEKAKFTAAKVISKLEKQATNWLKIKGGALGTKIGAVLGSLLGPAGTAIGGAIGGFLGEQAGEWVGDKVVKPLANTARKVAEKAIDTVKTVAKTVVSMGKQVVKKGIEFVGDIASKVLNLF
ncbi:hypothetical protein HT667_08520 [Ursidibacter maritimus]|uniref:glycine zipper domain-containing protein n=1 Tax=Ursidibacter maritimus TaxID=1331689 RepID=UPI001C447467|nr:hypothetical protein [Ursidibacter maritimus]MBV6541496.1 hypothetical protein [Ursidibacter maritimus]